MVKTVQPPSEANLRKAYKEADPQQKKLLEIMYPEVFKPRPPMEWVNTFELLCQAAGVDVVNYEVLPSMSYKERADVCMDRLMLLETVFNEGVLIDLANTRQQKWYPWHRIIPAPECSGGFRLAFDDSRYGFADADLGARPYFLNKKISDFVGDTFCFLYLEWAQNFQLSKSNP
jgi:hypothetical protein